MIDYGSEVRVVEKNKVPVIQFPILDDYPVVHGFSTRLGGVSKGDYTSMNLSFTRGDQVEDVKANYCLFADAIGFDVKDLVLTQQVHSTNILRVGKEDCGEVFKENRTIQNMDGLVTNEPGVMLMTFFADCVPLMFYDPVHHAVGNAHSGWRGTVNKMGQKMVEKMVEEFNSDPKEMIAIVGPSICKACYEVSEEVIDEVKKIIPKEEQADVFYEKVNGHYQLDLWETNKKILLLAGLKEENICISGLCTNCHPDLLFSHRYTGGKRGNLAAVIGLK